jgi:imidazole glycerol-phosphate synthase subunit HisH
MSKVTIIDCNVGNLRSVAMALAHCGAEVTCTREPGRLVEAERVVLPGVGAFPDVMARLKERGFDEPIKNFAASDKPLLGICVGMQVLFDVGEEFRVTQGLGLIPGRVSRIPLTGVDGRRHLIPHIGWSPLDPANDWTDTIFNGMPEGTEMYFVHSYTAIPESESHRLADVDYDGCRISAAVRLGNIYGTQFHPEKSGEPGLKVLRNFLALNKGEKHEQGGRQ